MDTYAARIRELNDAFRTTLVGGRILMTSAVAALPQEKQADVINRVRTFDKFDKDNDPHGEHDFGVFRVGDETFFWKIDYYDNDFRYGADDAANPATTARVLTIMFAREY